MKDDLISRQEALEALKRDEVYDEDIPNRADGVRDAIITISNLPSAQPKQVCVATVTLTDEQVKEAVEEAKNAVISVIKSEPYEAKEEEE